MHVSWLIILERASLRRANIPCLFISSTSFPFAQGFVESTSCSGEMNLVINCPSAAVQLLYLYCCSLWVGVPIGSTVLGTRFLRFLYRGRGCIVIRHNQRQRSRIFGLQLHCSASYRCLTVLSLSVLQHITENLFYEYVMQSEPAAVLSHERLNSFFVRSTDLWSQLSSCPVNS